jgi:hypothetical protein
MKRALQSIFVESLYEPPIMNASIVETERKRFKLAAGKAVESDSHLICLLYFDYECKFQPKQAASD